MNEEAVVREHLPLAHQIADRFFLPSGDRESLRQEAAVALVEAARSYQPRHGLTFRTFASYVIERRVMDHLNFARREKRRAQEEAVRTATDEEGEVVSIVDLLPGGGDTLDAVIAREEFRALIEAIRRLTPLERAALVGVEFLDEAYTATYVKDKMLDNAIQRARRKLKAAA